MALFQVAIRSSPSGGDAVVASLSNHLLVLYSASGTWQLAHGQLPDSLGHFLSCLKTAVNQAQRRRLGAKIDRQVQASSLATPRRRSGAAAAAHRHPPQCPMSTSLSTNRASTVP